MEKEAWMDRDSVNRNVISARTRIDRSWGPQPSTHTQKPPVDTTTQNHKNTSALALTGVVVDELELVLPLLQDLLQLPVVQRLLQLLRLRL